MSFPRAYAGIKDAMRKWMLQTPNARSIVRKADVRVGTGTFVGHSEVLWSQGWAWNTQVGAAWSINKASRPGVWGIWPSRTWEDVPYTVPGQYVYADLRGIAFARVNANITLGNGRPTIAYVPVYSGVLNPMESREDEPTALQFWVCPDGRTLLEWDADLRPGGPRAFEWPPKGACQPLATTNPTDVTPNAQIAGMHAGKWAPPPKDSLGDEVVCAVAIIVNATQAELDANTYTYNVRSWLQLQGIAEETEAWRAHYGALGEIED